MKWELAHGNSLCPLNSNFFGLQSYIYLWTETKPIRRCTIQFVIAQVVDDQIRFHPPRQITRPHMCSASYYPPLRWRHRPAIPRDNIDINTALLPHIKHNTATEMFQKPLIIGKMKVFSVIVLGVFALGVVTFKSVASLPKLKPTAAAAYDWHQFLPEGKPLDFTLLSTVSVHVAK